MFLISEGEVVNTVVSVAKCIFHLETLNQWGRVGKPCEYSSEFLLVGLEKILIKKRLERIW